LEGILLFFKIVLTILGFAGIALSHYWYCRRPSLIAIPSVLMLSVVFLISGLILPLAWLGVYGTLGTAKVTGIACQSGQKHHIYYELSVNEVIVSDIALDGYGNPRCNLMKIGDTAVVTFLPSDPNIHVWGRVNEYIVERIVAGLLALIVVPTFSYLAVRKRIKRWGYAPLPFF
jgi:hypothetical protein